MLYDLFHDENDDQSNYEEFPLIKCESCMHASVCGVILYINDTMGATPIDMSDADCKEYLPDVSSEGVVNSTINGESLFMTLLDTLEQLNNEGRRAIGITINEISYRMIYDSLNPGNLKSNETLEIYEPGTLQTPYGPLKVTISESQPTGIFILEVE